MRASFLNLSQSGLLTFALHFKSALPHARRNKHNIEASLVYAEWLGHSGIVWHHGIQIHINYVEL